MHLVTLVVLGAATWLIHRGPPSVSLPAAPAKARAATPALPMPSPLRSAPVVGAAGPATAPGGLGPEMAPRWLEADRLLGEPAATARGDSPGGASRSAGGAPTPATEAVRWVRSHLPSALWSGPDGAAVRFTDLPQWSWLRVVDEASGSDRLLVYYPGDGATRQPGLGWVPRADVGPVGAPGPGDLPPPAPSRTLPEWVQVHRATTFWSSAEADAVAFTDLPQWSYLELRGEARDGRLLAYYLGDYATRQPGLGWVEEAAVGPAAFPGRWLRNHRRSTLWSGPDADAELFGDLPQWSYLRVLEGAADSAQRVFVFYFGDGRARQPGPAWVPLADVGPVTPPAPLPEPQRPGSWTPPQAIGAREQRAFIERIAPAAQASQQATRVPASVAIAQAILESNWGRSRLAREANNLFGIKALDGPGSAGTITFRTWEHLGGRDVIVDDAFKAYASVEDSIRDHGQFFWRNPRYRPALAVANDARAFARAIHQAGYATDPAYSTKLIELMDRFDLYRYDLAP